MSDELQAGTQAAEDAPLEKESLLSELYLLKRRKSELLRQQVEIVDDFGLLAYRPHPKQDAFHRAGAKSRRGAFCGNRFGKSTMSCAEDCAWLMQERVWYPKSDPARYVGIPQRPVKGIVLTTDWGKVDEIWTSERGDQPGKLWTMLPKDFVKSKHRNHAGCIDEVECMNGSQLRFDVVEAWKRNPMSQESSDWDFINVDEPIPEKMWKGNARGLVDRGGFAWFTLTALQELWILDYFFPRKYSVKNLPMHYEQDGKWAIRGTIFDNIYLSAEGVKAFEADLNPQERECRLLGIPMELAGLVYKQFDWDTHVLKGVPVGWSAYNRPPKDWPVYIHIDPHPHTPHAVLFLTLDPAERRYIFDEIFAHCVISELCSMIHAKTNGLYVARVKCDPLAWINDPITGETMAQEFMKHGILVEKATKALHLGIMRVQDELSKPGLINVSPQLDEFHYEIQRYTWDSEKGRPVDKDDHMMEGMYRLLLDDPRYFDIGEFKRQGPIEDIVIGPPQLTLGDIDFNEITKRKH
jgi:hypothetical protein